jgi:hypothetical protein
VIAWKITLQAMILALYSPAQQHTLVLRIALNDSSHPSAASLDRNMPFVFGKAFSYNPATAELRLGKFPLSALASKDPHRIVRKNRRDF